MNFTNQGYKAIEKTVWNLAKNPPEKQVLDLTGIDSCMEGLVNKHFWSEQDNGGFLEDGLQEKIHVTNKTTDVFKKNEVLPLAATWMDLEIIILSDISQRKTNTISLICGI